MQKSNLFLFINKYIIKEILSTDPFSHFNNQVEMGTNTFKRNNAPLRFHKESDIMINRYLS